MDAIRNPFAPGAGTQPPELAGRDQILETARVALGRLKLGRQTRSQMMLGLRGVGKTVLLNRIHALAEDAGNQAVILEAPEGKELAKMLVPPLKGLLYKLSRIEQSREIARRGLGILRAFAGIFKVSVGDIDFGVNPEAGIADTGNMESDLPEMLQVVATAAKQADRPMAILIDEVQYLSSADLSALITSMHRLGQRNLPCILFGAGLPQLAGLAGEAKSYAERLFSYPDVGALSDDAAREAIRAPIDREGVQIAEEALDLIVAKTQGYPYFLQEWGYHTWNAAIASPITVDDVERASQEARSQLDSGFFRVRLDRLTPREKDYMCAMASLGAGPHRSGEIAQVLSMNVTNAAPLRSGLIKKGMVFSPQHGDTAFTVPMFDEFLRRSMPDWKPTAHPVAESEAKKRPKRRP